MALIVSPATVTEAVQANVTQVGLEQQCPSCLLAIRCPQGQWLQSGPKNPKSSLKRAGTPLSAIDKAKSKMQATPCTTCSKLHHSKCIHLSYLDKEQEELDSACKLKQAIAKNSGASVEAAYV
eukprot:188817-Rhodomonas_salina.4